MIRDGLIYVAGRYGAALLSLLAIYLFARLLGPEKYAIYSLVLSGSALAYTLLLHWLRSAAARFLPAAAPDERQRLLGQIKAVLICYVCAALICMTLILLSGEEIPDFVLFGFALFWATGVAEVGLAIAQAGLHAARFSAMLILRAFAAVLIGSTLVWAGFGAYGALAGAIIGNALIGFLGCSPLWTATFNLYDPQNIRKLLHFGTLSTVGIVLQSAQSFAEKFMLLRFHGLAAAGTYAACFDLTSRSLVVVLSALTLAGAPRIFRCYDIGGLVGARDALLEQSKLLFLLAMPCAVLVISTPVFVADAAFGQRYGVAASALIIPIAAATVLQLLQAGYFEFSFSLTKLFFWQTIAIAVGAASTVMLCWLLVPEYAELGAAWARALGALISLSLCIAGGARVLSLPMPWRDVAFIGFGCLTMALILAPVIGEASLATVGPRWIAASAAYLCLVFLADIAGLRTKLLSYARMRTNNTKES